ncbi:MarR family winged helix-turn-helix transcriptional regulator [Streptomyces sp. NPDC056387]|uniref:MarR family winged helix-turn-helix transcriptional regulator n=1 Tax=Streptomyces sp. NPDC056387 TaxID=3345803 RepID=UPI0035E17925
MKPIGYWLNRTDRALTRSMNDVLGEFGLTRIVWQVLNVLDATPEATDAEVLSLLAANADIPTLTAAVDTVLAQGWATRSVPDRLVLTPGGRRCLADAGARIEVFRERSVHGIPVEDYRTAVRVLERMTGNLEEATTADGAAVRSA